MRPDEPAPTRDGLKGDLELMCPQCGEDWILTEAERRARFEKGLERPKRCPSCRREKEKEGSA